MLGFLLKFQYSKHPEGKEKASLQTSLRFSILCPANKVLSASLLWESQPGFRTHRSSKAEQQHMAWCPAVGLPQAVLHFLFQLNISAVFINWFVVGAQ